VNGELHFDFTRHPGAATTRTAIALLASAGASESVIAMARERAERLAPTSAE
jgi:DNA mismatch repair ATPase MutS